MKKVVWIPSLVRPRASTIASPLSYIELKTWQEQQEDKLKGDICYLGNICRAKQPYTCTIEDELNIDGSMKVSTF